MSVAAARAGGPDVDEDRNTEPSSDVRTISTDGSRVAVLVVPTDEERESARQARDLLGRD